MKVICIVTQRNVPSVALIHTEKHALLLTHFTVLMISGHLAVTFDTTDLSD